MSTSCVIRFNNSEGVYYGGQILSGVAELTTLKPKTIRGIHITIEGFAAVKWTERKSRQENGKTVYYTVLYSGNENYLSSRSYVLGGEGRGEFNLAPGKYSYEFQLALPVQVPSSFEGEYGHVRYQVTVAINRPWRFDNVFKKCFTVVSSLDLNMDPRYKMPLHTEDEKHFCCCCCASGPVTARIDIPFSGYAPGQNIPISVLVDNETTTDCTDVTIKLEKDVKFISQFPQRDTKHTTTKIKSITLGPVPKLCKKQFNEKLQLPALPPTSLNTCSIIDISYRIYIFVHTPGCHSKMEMMLPMVVGNVPLFESATNISQVITVQPSAPTMSGDDSPPGYNATVPPSYEEACIEGSTFLKSDEDERATIEPYLPKYPVYHNFVQPSAPADDDQNAGSNSIGKGVNYGWSS